MGLHTILKKIKLKVSAQRALLLQIGFRGGTRASDVLKLAQADRAERYLWKGCARGVVRAIAVAGNSKPLKRSEPQHRRKRRVGSTIGRGLCRRGRTGSSQ